MGRIDDIANRYVDEWAALSPVGATYVGISGYDDRIDDLSADGRSTQNDLNRRTVAELEAAEPASDGEFVAREAMLERLRLHVERFEAGEDTSEINVISSPVHNIRGIFDLMPEEGEEAVANIAARMAALPAAFAQFQQTVLDAAGQGHVSSRVQILEMAKQCDIWTSTDGDDFYNGLARRLQADGALRTRLDQAAAAATAATVAFGDFLRKELAPLGTENQAAGRERYALASRYFLGAAVDLDETYAWGFEELHRLETEMRSVSKDIAGPDASIDDAVAKLDADPKYSIHGKEAFRQWMQELGERAIADLNGTHFDIPEPVLRIEACLAPTSDGGIYYTGPSEDFSRPGRMWWAVPQGIDTFSTWREVTTVYHEGAPGHHLQIA